MTAGAVITAIYDGFDTLKPALPQDGLDIDWVLVTDDPSIPDGHCGWRVVREPRPGEHPNRAAKAAKLRPWEYTGAPASIWIDASYRIISPAFARDAMTLASPVAQFTHPWRDCLYQEVDASLALRKYDGEPLREQAAAYRQAGHPEHWGLWSAGALAATARRSKTSARRGPRKLTGGRSRTRFRCRRCTATSACARPRCPVTTWRIRGCGTRAAGGTDA